MPVYGVSVDVGTAAGKSVKMMAYDAAQRLLGTVQSSPITNYPNLVGPIEFESTVPIASVKWLSSQSSAGVLIDNLRLEVDRIVDPDPPPPPPGPPVAGDYDSDGDVDGADFVAWQSNFPTAGGATLAQGDGDSDGDVDGADFVIWQTGFLSLPVIGPAVPEPCAGSLGAFAVAAIGVVLHRRRAAVRSIA
jgi:hypothetical protein